MDEKTKNFLVYNIPGTDEEVAGVMPMYKVFVIIKLVILLIVMYLALK